MEPNRVMRWLSGGLLAGMAWFGAGCDGRNSAAEPVQSAQRPSLKEMPRARNVTPPTNMVHIPAGRFTRLKQEVVLTRDFWIGKFEVTQAEYSALMQANPSHFTGDPRCPVEKVSQADAVAFCEALTARERGAGNLPDGYEYRLPTEAEWEYACRAGSTNHFSFGDGEAVAEAHAWTEENSGQRTHPVGEKAPNAWGLHDMHGNVWEWCHDWFADYADGEVTDPTGPPGGEFKVFRGGGWNQAAKFARCSNRFMMAPSNGIHFVGFRVALGPELPKAAPASATINPQPDATP